MAPPDLDEHGPSTSRRSRRPLRAVLLGLLLLALVALLVEREGDRLERQIARAVARRVQASGGSIEWRSFDVSPWHGVLRAEDVALSWPLSGDDQLEARVSKAFVRVGWTAAARLALGRVHLSEVELDGPRIEIRRGPSPEDRDGESVPIVARIDRLRIRDGTIALEDRQLQLELVASGFEIDAVRPFGRQATAGRVRFRADLERAPLTQPLPVDVEAEFRWRSHDIELTSIRASGAGLRFDGDGRVGLLAGASAIGRGELRVNLGLFERWLPPEMPRLAGRAAGSVSLELVGGAPRVRGSLVARDLNVDRLHFPRFESTLLLAPGSLEALDIDAAVFDGRVRGTARLDWQESMLVAADLVLSDLRSEGLLDWLGLPLPFSSRIDGSIELSGAPDRRASLVGEGRFDARPSDGDAPWPASARGTVRLGQGRVVLDASELTVGSASLEVAASAPIDPAIGGALSVRLAGRTSEAETTRQATLDVIDSLGLALPDTLDHPLGGDGSIASTITRRDDATAVSLALDLQRARIGSERFDRAAVELVVEGATLELRRLELERETSRLDGTARFGLEPLELRAARAEAESIDAAWLGELLALPFAPTGLVSGQARLEQLEGGLGGTGRLQLTDGTLFGEDFDLASATFSVDRSGIRLDDASLTGPAVSMEAYGRIPLDGTPARVVVERGTLELSRLAALDSFDPRPSGTARFEGLLRMEGGEPRADLRVDGDAWRLGEFGPGPFRAHLRLDPRAALIGLHPRGADEWSASISVGLDDGFPFDALIESDGTPLVVPTGLVDATLTLGGSLELSGRLDALGSTRGRARLEPAAVRIGRVRLLADGPVGLSLDGGVVTLPPVRLIGEESAFSVDGELRLEDGSIDLELEGVVALALLASPRTELRARGQATTRIDVGGSIAEPVISGHVEVDDGRLRWLGFPYGLDRLSMTIDASEGTVRVRECRARLGNGELLAEGDATLDGLLPAAYGARVQGANIRFEYPDGFRGVYEGELTLAGTAAGARLAGDVRLLRGLYDRNVTLLGLAGVGVREYGEDDASALPRDVELDVGLHADGNVWVRNDQAEVESRISLQIGGTLQQPEVLGRLELMRDGTIRVRDVEYTIDSGAVDLVDLQRIDPYLTLRAHTAVRDYTVYLRVEGTADRFEYELTSEPTLTTQDIIALLTTGSTLEDLASSGGGAQFTGDLAANYFAGALTDRFERQLRGLLGFDRIEIDPLLVRGGADPTTRVTLGKRVTRDLFVVFSTEIGATERQIYQIEWQASRKMRLSAERDTLGGIGGEVRYADRFWWHRRHAEAAASAPGDTADAGGSRERPAEVAVRRVEIRGVDDAQRGELRRRLGLGPGSTFSRSKMFADVEALRRALIRERRIEAEVDAQAIDVDGGVDVIYDVRPGPRVLVLFEGVGDRERKKLRELLRTEWVESVDHDELWEAGRRRVARWFRRRGYYAVDVLLESQTDGDVRRTTFIIDRGKLVQVTEVGLDGVEHVPEDRVRRQMLTRPRSLFSRNALLPEELDKDLAAIRNLYRDLGFLDVAIEEPSIRLSIDGERAVIRLSIDEGEQFRIGRLTFPEVAAIRREQLEQWSGLTPGELFSPGRLLRAESALRAALDEQGYADARVRALMSRDGARVAIGFEIEPGELKRVAEIAISGNRLTKERIIRRELTLGVGDLLSRDGLLGSQHGLYKLGIFRNVRLRTEPLAGSDAAAQRLVVMVDEAAPFSTSLGVGYDSEARGRVSFSLGHENVGGWDRELAIQGRLSSLERRLQLVAKEPRLFGGRSPLLIDLLGERREEVGFTFERRATAVRIDRELAPRWTGYLRYGFQRVDLLEVSGGDPPEETRLGDLGVAFTRDSRDDPFLTRNGTLFEVGSRLFAPGFLSEKSFSKHTARFSSVRSFTSGLTVASAVRLGVAEPFGSTTRVPTSERFFAGGDATLRGFGRNRVGPLLGDEPTGGEGMLLFNHELRFPIWGAMRGVVFYDAGNVWADADAIRLDDLRHVLGTGVRLETRIGPLRLEYGRKLDRMAGESSGELFLAIGSSF